jgi:hypothetical protein
MASNIYIALEKSTNAKDYIKTNVLKCCDNPHSHYAIIAKGNIIEGIEAKE